jgi:hypothetical protein
MSETLSLACRDPKPLVHLRKDNGRQGPFHLEHTGQLQMGDPIDETSMASLNAAKQHLRAAMKQKLKALPYDAILSQSTRLDHT